MVVPMMPVRAAAIAALLALAPAAARAQLPHTPDRDACTPDRLLPLDGLADSRAELARILEVAGYAEPDHGLSRRRSSTPAVRVCPGFPGDRAATPLEPDDRRFHIGLLPVTTLAAYNSAYPDDRANGVLWAGRGLSALARAGVRARFGPLTAAIAPEFAFSANDDFPTITTRHPGLSEFANPYHPTSLDWPQRFGTDAFSSIHSGQSYVRIDAFGAAAGFSTENIWWGPARHNPLLLSNTAPGFPHVFAGTSRPVDVWIGRLGLEFFWGRVRESGFYDGDPANDRRAFSGQLLTFQPRGLDGLALGIAHLHMEIMPPGGYSIGDYLDHVFDNLLVSGSTNKPGNGMGAVFARWLLPAAGFEVWAEWARDDYAWDLRDFLNEPDHAQVYALGFQKVIPGPGRWFHLYGELAHLEGAISSRSGRGLTAFYTGEASGLTNRGQLLGAPIGPGSDTQLLGAGMLSRWGWIGTSLQRIRWDANAYHASWARDYGAAGYDVEISGAIDFRTRVRGVDLAASILRADRHNRMLLGGGGPQEDFPIEHNWGARIHLSWWPGAAAPAPLFFQRAPR